MDLPLCNAEQPDTEGWGGPTESQTVKARGGRLIAKGKNTDFPRLSSLAMQAERQVFQHGRRA